MQILAVSCTRDSPVRIGSLANAGPEAADGVVCLRRVSAGR